MPQCRGVSGSPSYIRLRYLIEALNTAQGSVTSLDEALKNFNSAATPTLALAAVFIGAKEAQDDLRCAAALINKYPSSADDDKTIKTALVSAFNREADVVADVTADSKNRILNPAKMQTNTSQLRHAERIAARTASQNEAATDIAEATTFAILLSIESSDPTAKTTEYLAVNCDEYASLLKEVDPLVHIEKSAYSQSGGLIQHALEGHKCRSLSN